MLESWKAVAAMTALLASTNAAVPNTVAEETASEVYAGAMTPGNFAMFHCETCFGSSSSHTFDDVACGADEGSSLSLVSRGSRRDEIVSVVLVSETAREGAPTAPENTYGAPRLGEVAGDCKDCHEEGGCHDDPDDGSCDEHAGCHDASLQTSNSIAAAIENKDIDAIRELLTSKDGHVALNAARSAVQFTNCKGRLVGHYSIDKSWVAALQAEQ